MSLNDLLKKITLFTVVFVFIGGCLFPLLAVRNKNEDRLNQLHDELKKLSPASDDYLKDN